MRHYKKGRKLGSDASHTKAIKKSILVALFANDRIKTSLERAKEVRGDVDRVITWAKQGSVQARRLAIAKVGDKDLVAEVFSKVEQGMYKDRPGGYTRIYKLGKRRGDSATIVILELVQEAYTATEARKQPKTEEPELKPLEKNTEVHLVDTAEPEPESDGKAKAKAKKTDDESKEKTEDNKSESKSDKAPKTEAKAKESQVEAKSDAKDKAKSADSDEK